MTDYAGLEESIREILSRIVTQVEDEHANHLTEELRLQSRTLDDYAKTIEARDDIITKLDAENRTLIKLQEPHYASSEVIPENQLEHILYDTITERNELKDRIAELLLENAKLREAMKQLYGVAQDVEVGIREWWRNELRAARAALGEK